LEEDPFAKEVFLMGKAMEALEKRIPMLNKSNRAKELMEVWPKIVRMEFRDEPSPFYMIVENGQIKLEKSFAKEPEIILAGDGQEFVKVASGEKDISHPLFFGQIRIAKGTVKEVMVLSRIIGSIK
jgi:putative sterol carrier protein